MNASYRIGDAAAWRAAGDGVTAVSNPDPNWIDIGSEARARRARPARSQGRRAHAGAELSRWPVRRGVESLQPRRRTAGPRPARRRVRGLPVASIQVPSLQRRRRTRLRRRSRAFVCGAGRERTGAGQRRSSDAARPPAEEAASAGTQDRARGRTGARRRHLDHHHAGGQSALLHLRSIAAGGAGSRRRRTAVRDAADPPARPALPPLRGLLLAQCACLHLALLDHAGRPGRPDDGGLRSRGALGRRAADRHADPLGRGQFAVLQDGRAHELHPEPDDHRQPGADPAQDGGLHRHRRAGQCAGGGRPAAGLLRRTRLRVPALPLRRALAGLDGRGHGEERGLCAGQRIAARRHARAGGARRRHGPRAALGRDADAAARRVPAAGARRTEIERSPTAVVRSPVTETTAVTRSVEAERLTRRRSSRRSWDGRMAASPWRASTRRDRPGAPAS